MLSFVFFLKKFRTLRNNVSSCFSIGFTHPAFGVISSTNYLCFDLLVLMHWSCALVISVSVFLFKSPFHNQFHDFISTISSVFLMNWPGNLLLFPSCFILVCRLCLVIFRGSVTSCSPDDLHATEMSLS